MARILRTSPKPAPIEPEPEIELGDDRERLAAQLAEVRNQLLTFSLDIHNGHLRPETVRYIRERQDVLVSRWVWLDTRYRCALPA